MDSVSGKHKHEIALNNHGAYWYCEECDEVWLLTDIPALLGRVERLEAALRESEHRLVQFMDMHENYMRFHLDALLAESTEVTP